ncbi:hypothetical protein [Actinoplanes awajinensis]|uniref:PIN domain-containing protein n=1 Tax=Actinoplanes awajinensis subsp. mycoplanecinus TaxID=135947 RepID=A0A124G9D5_9ACTN|nr:hypothetical protein [Actinoplanes awajinensis]KUL28827.1 hypothetical protein ADL15_30470 [Actinoplanes awajinensis subsp. mycoplanecinus]
MSAESPLILDASALVELFQGHPVLMRIMEGAGFGDFTMAVPTNAVLEAQVVLRATPSIWNQVLSPHRTIVELPLDLQAAIEAGDLARPRLEHHPMHRVLIGPPMVAQVLREALGMNGMIVTAIPEAYGGHDVAIKLVDWDPGV